MTTPNELTKPSGGDMDEVKYNLERIRLRVAQAEPTGLGNGVFLPIEDMKDMLADLDALRQRCEAAERNVEFYRTQYVEATGKLDPLASQVGALTKRLRHCNCCGNDMDASTPEDAPIFVKCAACDTKDCDRLTAAEQRVRELEATRNPLHCDECFGRNWIPCKEGDAGAIPMKADTISWWQCGYCFYKAENARIRERHRDGVELLTWLVNLYKGVSKYAGDGFHHGITAEETRDALDTAYKFIKEEP